MEEEVKERGGELMVKKAQEPDQVFVPNDGTPSRERTTRVNFYATPMPSSGFRRFSTGGGTKMRSQARFVISTTCCTGTRGTFLRVLKENDTKTDPPTSQT